MKPSEKWIDKGYNNSWGEAIGISRSLIFVADEIYQLRKEIELQRKVKEQ